MSNTLLLDTAELMWDWFPVSRPALLRFSVPLDKANGHRGILGLWLQANIKFSSVWLGGRHQKSIYKTNRFGEEEEEVLFLCRYQWQAKAIGKTLLQYHPQARYSVTTTLPGVEIAWQSDVPEHEKQATVKLLTNRASYVINLEDSVLFVFSESVKNKIVLELVPNITASVLHGHQTVVYLWDHAPANEPEIVYSKAYFTEQKLRDVAHNPINLPPQKKKI